MGLVSTGSMRGLMQSEWTTHTRLPSLRKPSWSGRDHTIIVVDVRLRIVDPPSSQDRKIFKRRDNGGVVHVEQVVTASNVTAFSAAPFLNMHGATILINGQAVRSNPTRTHLHWFLTVG